MGSPSWGQRPVSTQGTMRSGSSTAARARTVSLGHNLGEEFGGERAFDIVPVGYVWQAQAKESVDYGQGFVVLQAWVPLYQCLHIAVYCPQHTVEAALGSNVWAGGYPEIRPDDETIATQGGEGCRAWADSQLDWIPQGCIHLGADALKKAVNVLTRNCSQAKRSGSPCSRRAPPSRPPWAWSVMLERFRLWRLAKSRSLAATSALVIVAQFFALGRGAFGHILSKM